MISPNTVKKYCTNYTEIENYEEAVADVSNIWDCHHKLEIHEDYVNSTKDMVLMNLYYNRPPGELIFIKHDDHMKLHESGKHFPGMLNKHHSEDTKAKIAKAATGRKLSMEVRRKLSALKKGKHWKIINGKRTLVD